MLEARWVHCLLAGNKITADLRTVFRIAALSVFLMLFFVLLFFKEPRRADDGQTASLAQVGNNFLTVLSNPRFMLFLLIFTGYWIVFWQEFIALPLYISAYIDPNANTARILATDPIVVICFTMLIGFLTKTYARVSRHRAGNVDLEPGVDSADRASFGVDGGGNTRCRRHRRDHAGTALLRLHLAPRAVRINRERIWGLHFFRSASDRLLPANSADG